MVLEMESRRHRTPGSPEKISHKPCAFGLRFRQRVFFTLNVCMMSVAWVPLDIFLFDLASESTRRRTVSPKRAAQEAGGMAEAGRADKRPWSQLTLKEAESSVRSGRVVQSTRGRRPRSRGVGGGAPTDCRLRRAPRLVVLPTPQGTFEVSTWYWHS